MGIWQATAYQVRGLEPSLEMAGPACQVSAFPKLGGWGPGRERQSLAGLAGAGNPFRRPGGMTSAMRSGSRHQPGRHRTARDTPGRILPDRRSGRYGWSWP